MEILSDASDEGEDMIYSILSKMNETEPGHRVIINRRMFDQIYSEINENLESAAQDQKELDDLEEKMQSAQGEYYDMYGNQIRTHGRRHSKQKNTK